MKKKLNYLLLIAFCLVLVTACSNDDDPIPDYTQPKPAWKLDQSVNYDATMTSVVVLPNSLQEHAQDNDLLAVFVGEECRGIASVITQDNEYYYFLTIKGYYDEQGKIAFKYYSMSQSYLYTTNATLEFEPDRILGVIDNPVVLDNLALVTD
jgi:hypothetical protein